MSGVTAAGCWGGSLEQPGRQLREGARQAGEVQGFDETLRGADLACRSCPEETAQLLMHRCAAVLRHGLEAPERVELGLSLEHTLDGLGAERPDQLVLEIVYAREEAEGAEGVVGGDRNARTGERSPDVQLVGDVVHAAEVRAWVRAHEVREHPWEVGYAGRRPDLDSMRARIATDAAGQRANRRRVALALDEHQGADRCRGCHAYVSGERYA